MKIFILASALLFSYTVNAQIITNDDKVDQPEKEKEQKEIIEEKTPKNGFEVYFGVAPAYTYRTLLVNEGLFGDPLGERENEVGEWISSLELGVRNELTNNLQLQFGIGYARNRESYAFEDMELDSLYRYTNTYRHISFPIRLNYQVGNEIALFGGIGFMPKAFLSMEKVETVIDINNQEAEITSLERDGFNFFVIDAMASIGTKIAFNEHYGIFALFEARRQLTNTFDNQQPYIRQPYALGFNAGIQVYL